MTFCGTKKLFQHVVALKVEAELDVHFELVKSLLGWTFQAGDVGVIGSGDSITQHSISEHGQFHVRVLLSAPKD